MSRKMSRYHSLSRPRVNCLRMLVVLAMAAALSVLALAQSQEFPTYTPGENTSATTGPTFTAPLSDPWVVSDGTIITPAGTQVYLGTTTRAKAIALNPTGNGTAAVLQMGAPQSVSIFCVATAGCDGGTYVQGQVMQNYIPSKTNSGSSIGSPIRRMASTCCLARTATTAQPTLPSQTSTRPACSPITLRSVFRSTSTAAAI